MTISLAQIDIDSVWIQGATLAAVAIGITALVYGTVALLVKADDFGLLLSSKGRLSLTRATGRGIVKGMPTVMKVIATIGTVAMLWVGGSIIVHGLHDLGWHWPYETIKDIAYNVGGDSGFIKWAVTAGLDGVLGLILGLILIPIVTKLIVPVTGWLFPEKAEPQH